MPSNIVVPEVGESIVDARVAKWLRKEGESALEKIAATALACRRLAEADTERACRRR